MKRYRRYTFLPREVAKTGSYAIAIAILDSYIFEALYKRLAAAEGDIEARKRLDCFFFGIASAFFASAYIRLFCTF